jgi:hypothetical protein
LNNKTYEEIFRDIHDYSIWKSWEIFNGCYVYINYLNEEMYYTLQPFVELKKQTFQTMHKHMVGFLLEILIQWVWHTSAVFCLENSMDACDIESESRNSWLNVWQYE